MRRNPPHRTFEDMKQLYLFLLIPVLCFAQAGGRQKMQKRCLKPSKSVELEAKVPEGSGLTFWNDRLWTHNDSGRGSQLFSIDTATAKITEVYELSSIRNKDWEDISQDSLYFYIADTGNNFHLRERLQIYRVNKRSLLQNRPVIDSIVFRWPDEATPGGNSKKRNYNCEALVVTADSIYLFTKEKKRTAAYSVPKFPGEYVARFKAAFKTRIRITGACFSPAKKRLVLCGYNKFLQTFLLDFSGFEGTEFFSAKATRIRIRKHFRQTEGVTTFNGADYYLINEHFRQPWLLDKKQGLHFVKLL